MDASSHGILAVLIMVGAPGFDQQLLNQPFSPGKLGGGDPAAQ